MANTPEAPKQGSAARRILRNPDLRRVFLSWGTSKIAYWGWIVTRNAVAFNEGGTWAVGLILALNVIPSSVFTPFISVWADRIGVMRGLAAAAWIRASAMIGTAVVVFLDFPLWTLVAFAIMEGFGQRPQDTLHMRVLPWLARTPEELTSANSLTEVLRSSGILMGPAIGAGLLLFATPKIAFTIFAVGGLFGALALRGLANRIAPAKESDALNSLKKGFQAILAHRDFRILALWYCWTTTCVASLQVFGADLAIDHLGLGDSGPSMLSASFGAGGLAGGLASFRFAGRQSQALPIFWGAILVGLGFVLPAIFPVTVMTFISYGIGGIGLTLLMVCGSTLMQRGVPLKLHGSIFGINTLAASFSFGLGGLLGSALTSAIGLRFAMGTTGIAFVTGTIAALGMVRRLSAAADSLENEVEILRRTETFHSLPIGPLERLAAALEPLTLNPGEVATQQGEAGRDFFILTRGRMEVLVDDQKINELEVGETFGEIALIRELPRTATVRALEPCELLRLGIEDFLIALEASPEALKHVLETSQARLDHSSPQP